MVIGTFTRFCWLCSQNKSALGGRLDKRKLWRCATCMEKMTNIWKKGPPPSIGWWPTAVGLHRILGYRWWDGECWSWPAFMHESAEKAAHWARKKETLYGLDIEWTDRPKDWPERSKT